MADSIDRVFAHALQTVRKIPRTGTSRPPATERLKLYGLYKQSMEGDVSGIMPRPSTLPPSQESELSREEKAEVEKWDAWSACAGLTRSEAKIRYIDTLIGTMHTYAYGSVEAKELVDELEFVWGQVRGNTSFGGGEKIGSERTSRRRGQEEEEEEEIKEGLRVLRPMSDQDDAEDDVAELDGATAGSGERARGKSWQDRVDRALVQMTAEIAALREVVEARGRSFWGTKVNRQGWISWFLGRTFALFRRVLVDVTVVVALVVVWKYRTGGPDEVVRLWIEGRARLRRRIKTVVDAGGNG